jgi:hypothetical protein
MATATDPVNDVSTAFGPVDPVSGTIGRSCSFAHAKHAIGG